MKIEDKYSEQWERQNDRIIDRIYETLEPPMDTDDLFEWFVDCTEEYANQIGEVDE